MTCSLASRALDLLGRLLIGSPDSIAAGTPAHFYYVAGDRPPPEGGIQHADTQRRQLTVDAIRRRLTMHVAVWTSVVCLAAGTVLALAGHLAHPAPSHLSANPYTAGGF